MLRISHLFLQCLSSVLLCSLLQGSQCLAQANTVRHLQVLTTIQEIQELGTEKAKSGYPLHLTGKVTYIDPEWGMLFLQDATGAIFAIVGHDLKVASGDLVSLSGKTSWGSTSPIAVNTSVKVISRKTAMQPDHQDLAALEAGSADGTYVETVGILRSGPSLWDHSNLKVVDGEISVPLIVPESDEAKLLSKIGAKVIVRAASGIQTDGKNHRIGAQLFSQTLEDIQPVDPIWKAAFDQPPSSVLRTASSDVAARFLNPVHLRGTVLWNGAGVIVLRDETGSIDVESVAETAFKHGDAVEVVGFPAARRNTTVLVDAIIRSVKAANSNELPALPRSAAQALRSGHDGDSIRLTGKLLSQGVRGKDNVFTLEDHETRFEVLLTGVNAGNSLVTVAPDSILQATGILRIVRHRDRTTNSIQLLVSSPSQVVVKNGPNINWRLILSVVTLFTTGGVFLWIVQMRRALRSKTKLIREQLEHETKQEDRYRRLFERNLAAVFSWLPSGEITDCNPAFAQLLGFDSPEEVTGRSYWAFLLDESRLKLIGALKRGEVIRIESSLRRGDGQILHLLENITFVPSETEPYYETTALDITQAKQDKLELQLAKDAAQREAENDPLTSLANRRRFSLLLQKQLKDAQSLQQPCALLYFDLDGFKAVNDTLGHVAGDLLLQKVARRLGALIQPGDTLCRIGGDEFAILLTREESVAAPTAVANQVLNSFSSPFAIGSQDISIGASIGISIYPKLAPDDTTLLQQADSAMYVAKRSGKNRAVLYTPEIGTAEHEKNLILSELKGAVTRQEISLQYQPVFETQTGHLIRFEALARWHNRVLGNVTPDKFIPIAEETGIISELGAYLLDMACRDCSLWQQATGQAIPVAVNTSTMQLRSETFVEDVLQIIKRNGLSADAVELEMTESVMLDVTGDSSKILNNLRSSGIGLALDDFGTGYSCLSYLSDLPFDRLKVDRSFLRKAALGGGGEALIHAVVSIAHALEMAIVLEGVETAHEMEFAQKLGADEVQGYWLGRPCSEPAAIIEREYSSELPHQGYVHSHRRHSHSRQKKDRIRL